MSDRNLNPHKAAVAAMFIYSREYASQSGGSMDFWDSLDRHKKEVCLNLVSRMEAAPSVPSRYND